MIVFKILISWFLSGFIVGLFILLIAVLKQDHKLSKRDLDALKYSTLLGWIAVFAALKMLKENIR